LSIELGRLVRTAMAEEGAIVRATRQVLRIAVPFTVVMLTASGTPALADPPPSAKDVAASRQRVRDKARKVGRLQARLAIADGRLESLATQAETAVERYNGEVVKLGKARTAYRGAQRRLTGAQGAVRARRAEVGRIAADRYREGSSTPMAADVFGTGGPQGFMDRAQLTEVFSRQEAGTFGRLRAAQIVAGVFSRRAGRDLRDQQRLTKSAERAKTTARTAVSRQRASVRGISAEKRRLERQLKTARGTASSLARRHGAAARQAAAAAAHDTGDAGKVSKPSAPSGHGAAHSKGDIAANWALTQLGKPYVWAAAGPDSYDCSGLTMRAWQKAGVMLDHWTGTQWTSGPHVPTDQLHRGDLLLFGKITKDPGTIHHVGIYIGGGRMVEAPFTGADVRISSIWRPDLVGATRPSG
jgi:cell wall-associated NlpC family hydrolase